jgi:hypothetical protein
VHCDAASVELKVPAGQSTHTLSKANWPATHARQLPLLPRPYPIGHAEVMHAVGEEQPGVSVLEPAGQGRHASCDVAP